MPISTSIFTSLTWFLLLLGYIIAAIMCHALVCHTIKRSTVLLKFLLVGTTIGCILLWHFYHIYGFGVELISAAVSYAFVAELYIFMFTFVASSISVSILLKIRGGLTNIATLAESYSGKVMVANRLRRLQDIGLLSHAHNQLELTAKGNQLITRFNKLQVFFNFTSN